MPQLDTIYILTIYLWAWLILHLMVQKTKTMLMTMPPQKHTITNKMMTPPTWL